MHRSSPTGSSNLLNKAGKSRTKPTFPPIIPPFHPHTMCKDATIQALAEKTRVHPLVWLATFGWFLCMVHLAWSLVLALSVVGYKRSIMNYRTARYALYVPPFLSSHVFLSFLFLLFSCPVAYAWFIWVPHRSFCGGIQEVRHELQGC